MLEQTNLIELTTRIVEAHVQGAKVNSKEMPELIRETYAALAALGKAVAPEEEPRPMPATTARKSLSNPDQIISMIDGKGYKTLKRHITRHGYTPETYRETFGLAADYPMVAPAYSARRSQMAKQIGLGRKAGQPRAPANKAASSA